MSSDDKNIAALLIIGIKRVAFIKRRYMKILVCVKQVLFSESPIEIDHDNCWIHDTEDSAYCMNRYDEYAIEEALLIKEKFSDVTVDAISVGPGRVSSTLRKALAFGAGEGIHIFYEGKGNGSPHEIASLIAAYAGTENYDIIFTGVMAEDDMQCLVGPLVASMLNFPCATSVVAEDIDSKNRKISVMCEREGGFYEKATLLLPALLTIQSGINIPRYPALSNVLRSKKQKLKIIAASSLNKSMPREQIISHRFFEKSGKGVMLEGSPEEKADKLLDILHERSLI